MKKPEKDSDLGLEIAEYVNDYVKPALVDEVLSEVSSIKSEIIFAAAGIFVIWMVLG